MSYSKPRVGGIIALNIRDDDELIEAELTSGSDEILLTSHFGQAIRFKEEAVRDMGRTATGVIGIRLDKGDRVVSLEVIENPEATGAYCYRNGLRQENTSSMRTGLRAGAAKGLLL